MRPSTLARMRTFLLLLHLSGAAKLGALQCFFFYETAPPTAVGGEQSSRAARWEGEALNQRAYLYRKTETRSLASTLEFDPTEQQGNP